MYCTDGSHDLRCGYWKLCRKLLYAHLAPKNKHVKKRLSIEKTFIHLRSYKVQELSAELLQNSHRKQNIVQLSATNLLSSNTRTLTKKIAGRHSIFIVSLLQAAIDLNKLSYYPYCCFWTVRNIASMFCKSDSHRRSWRRVINVCAAYKTGNYRLKETVAVMLLGMDWDCEKMIRKEGKEEFK